MLVASLLLILVAVVLLVVGLADGSSALLISSIAASLLAAVALVTGARQAAATRATTAGAGPRDRGPRSPRTAAPHAPGGAEPEIPVQHVPTTFGTGGDGWRQPPESPVTGDVVGVSDPADGVGRWQTQAEPVRETRPEPAWEPRAETPWEPDAEPPWETTDPSPTTGAGWSDEPAAQQVPPADAARVARLDAEVRVVDGHRRYHLPSCAHLVGRDHEPLPVSEAVSLGFTPCARCAPDTTLLADGFPG
ncbi:hypothetical protein [Micromonospora sp. DT47]|uniref:hypothetical protein n=1 Tax=Micromonospora sp. DT47 TaxID=3393431 RepID=UPI003CE6D431